MNSTDVIIRWMLGTGHSSEQAKNFLNTDKYKYLIKCIDEKPIPVEQALKVLEEYPEISALLVTLKRKLGV